MLDAKTTLLLVLGIVGAGFVVFWGFELARAKRTGGERVVPNAWELLVGFVTDFLDTLGIGSFATTTTLYRWRKTIDDRLLPGTLNVGHTLPTIAQAYIYTQVVEVEMTTLVTMIVAAVAGSLFGAPIVARWPRRNVQVGLGLALLALTGVLVVRQLWHEPTEGTIGLSGGLFAAGVIGNFVLGALMTIGVGLYAPCLVMVSMLGMNPGTGFPIMMGSCAFLMPVGGMNFIQKDKYHLRAAIGLMLGGPLAVLVAAFIVKELPILYMKWLVVLVVVYTASSMIGAAMKGQKA